MPVKYFRKIDENIKWKHWRKVGGILSLTYT